MHYLDKSISDRSGTCENYATVKIVKQEQKERGKASDEATRSVEREKLTLKSGYLKYWSNHWKGKRAGRFDRSKECRHIVPTGNKVKME